MIKITVIGSGYVGLVAGACLADIGNEVTCVDNDKEKITSLSQGISPIYEPGIEKIIARNLQQRLFFSTEIEQAIRESTIVFIAVGTPEREDGSVDLKYFEAVIETIAKNLNAYKVIINKTTIPVGTLLEAKKKLSQITSTPFDIASNPEFLKEGTAIHDFFYPDRIVVGAENEKTFATIKSIYKPLLKENNFLEMDINSAELTKYAANAMLATRVSFMNELAIYAEKTNADIQQVQLGISSDKRIGNAFLNSGIGYGGSCFPKDVNGILQDAETKEVALPVIQGTKKTNDQQRIYFLDKIKRFFSEAKNKLSHKTLAIWGLAFKPNTDDIREAPALFIIDKLLLEKTTLNAHDPQATSLVKKIYRGEINCFADKYQALQGADGLIICTEWEEYRNPDFAKLAKTMNQKVIFDGRNILKEQAKKNGFQYFGIGI